MNFSVESTLLWMFVFWGHIVRINNICLLRQDPRLVRAATPVPERVENQTPEIIEMNTSIDNRKDSRSVWKKMWSKAYRKVVRRDRVVSFHRPSVSSLQSADTQHEANLYKPPTVSYFNYLMLVKKYEFVHKQLQCYNVNV